MNLYEQSIVLLIFFPVLTTTTVGLRIFVRTRLCKGAFGWDDVLLLVTTVGLLLWTALDWKAMGSGFGTDKFTLYTAARDDVCYIISGAVKVSVALVLYKLDIRVWMRAILMADMAVCMVWTLATTAILGVGCTANSPVQLRASVCSATNYAQETSYVVFNVLHLIIPINMTWGVKVRGGLKWAVLALFSVGLLAAAAAVMKLHVVVATVRHGRLTPALWYQAQLWALAEHGLSLFAAAVLAIRPIFAYVSTSLTSLSSSLRGKGKGALGLRSSGGGGGGGRRRASTRVMTRRIVGYWVQPFRPRLFSGGSGGSGLAGRGEGGSRLESRDEGPVRSDAPAWEDVELGGCWEEQLADKELRADAASRLA